MSGATFPRLKNWAPEILTNTDLNAEIDNILTHLDPTGVGDYSDTVAEMKLQTSPGSQGSESLATSLGGELERLRYVIQRILGVGTTYWYDTPNYSLSSLASAINPSLPPNRIVSGATTGNSSQMLALVPGTGTGTAASVILKGAGTPFAYFINGTSYTISTNVTVTGLSLGPATNAQALVNNTAAAGQQWTKALGQYTGTIIPYMSASTVIPGKIGQMIGLSTVGGEYMIGFVASTAAITNTWRGAFVNSASSVLVAKGVNHTDIITALQLGWFFANTAGSVAVTYTNPVIAGTQPTSFNTGDYWFDLNATTWKTYNAGWLTAYATLIGVSMQDTGGCVAARTFDSYVVPLEINNMELRLNSSTQVIAREHFTQVNIFGSLRSFLDTKPIWDLTANIDSGVTINANSISYLYMKETGVQVISDKAPLKRNDLRGFYHPAEAWRCLGAAPINSNTQFESPIRSLSGNGSQETFYLADWHAYNQTASVITTGPNNLTGAITYPTNADRFQMHITDPGLLPASWINNATGTWASFGTLALTPGLWRLSATLNFNFTVASVNQSPVQVAMAIDTNTTPLQIMAGYNYVSKAPCWAGDGPAPVSDYMSIIGYYAQITTSTTYKLSTRTDLNLTAMGGYSFSFIGERIDGLYGVPT